MKVTILNEEIDIRFCMAVEIAYEEITGEAFSIDALKKMKNALALGMASILTAKPETGITVERLMREATGQDIAELNKAVIESMTEWLTLPKVVTDEEAREPQPDVNEEKPKN